jgi:acyl carrier protein
MPDHDAHFEDLRHIVSAVLRVPADQITAGARISDLAHVESIKLLRIAGKIERHFGIELEDEVMFREASLRQVADEIVNLRRVQSAAA